MNIADSQKNCEVRPEERLTDAEVGRKSPEVAKPTNFERRFSGDPLIGTIIGGRFQIEELLGTGGTSVVYKAKQLCVNRYVAVKTLQFQIGDRPSLGERFQREIDSLLTLNHPNIVTVYDCVFDDDDQPFIVMDYLRGRSLDRLILEEGHLPLEKFLTVILQIFSAVEHAHKKGIVHRDLKPGNIVLVDDEMNFVKVVDFGLAKLGEEGRKITRSGELWGSPPYMSPEQCIGEPVDERSDIYSLGAVMFEMLSGREPFTAATVYELIQKHLLASPPPIANGNPEISIPPQLERVVFKALSKNPDNRYQSIGELKSAVLNACSADVNRDSGTRIEAIAAHAGSSDDLLTYVNAMAPYVVRTPMRSEERISQSNVDEGVAVVCRDDTICDSDTICDAERAGSLWVSLRAGFWVSIGLFLLSLVASCFYVIGTVDGIRTSADNRFGSSAAYASTDSVLDAGTPEDKSSLPNRVSNASATSKPTMRSQKQTTPKVKKPSRANVQQVRHRAAVQERTAAQQYPVGQRRTAAQQRTAVQQGKSVSQRRKAPAASASSHDPWTTLDGMRSR